MDSNHAAIVDALRKAGCSVQSLASVGANCPDILVGYQGVNVVMEIKAPKGKVKPGQEKWHAEWRGQVCVVRDPESALAAIWTVARKAS